ncbi:hypothetical protein [Candidatus Atelocyanobacterium thalassae]|uniref:Tetratricopeptide repeat protein n=1 Tax=Atelocyanobacterium thalassa (isolate ALOHA) TaxID=1453429 RepID=D3EMS5_ATETH|nr:hypothetical protein [Candidatus Atelocyanobacterium thalassa]ADB94775.1 hypothetical protein UCYN_00180 [Candidatus Atelocyanobacterium thalassa isolate ALOHA]MCH2543991.1 hypothetical protein [Candidatus Atelocyanobacterium sp. ALOHA_A2.5_9]
MLKSLMFSNKLFSIIFISLILEIATSVISPNPAMSQLTLSQQTIENQENNPDDISDFNNFRPLTQDNSLLSLQGGEKLMNEASSAINQENYDLAVAKLRQARKVFNQLSNFHLQLANSFSGIDTQVYDAQRNSALKTGQMRDSATYQLALVHRAQDQPELAVPLLVQIIRSQNPTTDLGKKSYQQLYELGFVSVPFNNQE